MGTYCRHGLIYADNSPFNRKTCIIFKQNFCLAPATILSNVFNEYQQEIIEQSKHDIKKDLRLNRIIYTFDNQIYRWLLQKKFKIIFDSEGSLHESNAKIVIIFKCRNIWNSFNDILHGFVGKTMHTQNNDNDLYKLLLSSFIMLKIDDQSSRVAFNATNISYDIFTELMNCNSSWIDENSADDDDIDKNNHLNKSKNSKQSEVGIVLMNNVRKLENVVSVSTPFGNECFLNTINTGRIANVFGDNKCLMVASMPLVNGCEGGAVYNMSKELIGVVISTTFDWNSENATLTLVAKFNEILAEFIEQTNLTNINIQEEMCWNDNSQVMCECEFGFEKFIVLIQTEKTWGSGCFVKVGDTRLIITCAHILDNITTDVICTWKCGRFKSNIIFKNPYFDQAYDIAVLDVPDDIPDHYFTKCNSSPLVTGDIVYSSGFPHFTSLGRAKSFLPSIFEGRVTKTSRGVVFTDASVQSGQSGGPIFNQNGALLAISISNSKDDAYNLIYPNINMSVPVSDILPILLKYCKTKGKSFLIICLLYVNMTQ